MIETTATAYMWIGIILGATMFAAFESGLVRGEWQTMPAVPSMLRRHPTVGVALFSVMIITAWGVLPIYVVVAAIRRRRRWNTYTRDVIRHRDEADDREIERQLLRGHDR